MLQTREGRFCLVFFSCFSFSVPDERTCDFLLYSTILFHSRYMYKIHTSEHLQP